MPNENNFWRNVASGVGTVAAGAALCYFVKKVILDTPEEGIPYSSNDNQNNDYENGRRRVGNEYRRNCTDPRRKGKEEMRSKLSEELVNAVYQCPICLDEIRRQSKIISCKSCYVIYHYKCFQECVRNDMANCAYCRKAMRLPLEYTCFCGKVKNPNSNSVLIPHTCGNVCSPGVCSLTCHPGPCND